MCAQRNANLGPELLGDLCSSGKRESVQIFLAISKIHGLLSNGIDFLLAFPQADLEIHVYM
jgi:hypothetical protein